MFAYPLSAPEARVSAVLHEVGQLLTDPIDLRPIHEQLVSISAALFPESAHQHETL
jgi:hypothetical protein